MKPIKYGTIRYLDMINKECREKMQLKECKERFAKTRDDPPKRGSLAELNQLTKIGTVMMIALLILVVSVIYMHVTSK